MAVDREGFAAAVTAALAAHPLIDIRRQEIAGLPPADWESVIIATGPLTSPTLAGAIAKLTGQDALAFFDALPRSFTAISIDMSIAWLQSRYDKAGPGGSGADYINCPLTREQYHVFVEALLAGDKVAFHDWETPYFDGCLPIEVMAERGRETLRHGPMKPVGLTNPHPPGVKPYAVVQLRQDNRLGTLFNIVGFQTKLRHGEQSRIFRTIPGLEKAEFARLGGFTATPSSTRPRCLTVCCGSRLNPACASPGKSPAAKAMWKSAAIGLLAGRFAAAERLSQFLMPPPATTAHGALLAHITGGHGNRHRPRPKVNAPTSP